MESDSYNIVLIEDNNNHADFILSLFNEHSHKIKVFHDGSTAIEYLKDPEVFPDVILTDNYLNDYEGTQIIEYFTNAGYNYAFILLTSNESRDLAIKALNIGALNYISKSSRFMEELPALVKKAIFISRERIEKKELERKLRVSEEKFRSLSESSDDLIMRFDRNFRHLYVNPAATKFLGIEAHLFIGKTHHELGFLKEEYEYWEQQIDLVFRTGNKIKQVAPVNNEALWFDWCLVPEFDENGEVKSVLSYSRDITDIIKTDKALKESEQKFKELNATKDRLFSIIAHDLRNPFASLLLSAELLDAFLDMSDFVKAKGKVESIYRAARKGYELLENLLDWSKFEQGTIHFNPQLLELRNTVQECISLVTLSAENKKIHIFNDVPEHLFVPADKNMLLTIIRNLISNAIKFTKDDGTVRISSKFNEHNIEMTISDSGIGMDSTILNKLFHIGENIKNKGTAGESGSGLGLILCKSFVEKHGGTIWAESELGKGSQFKFTIPVNINY